MSGGVGGGAAPPICKTSNRMAKALLLAKSSHAYYLNGRVLFLSVFLFFFVFLFFGLSLFLSIFLSVFRSFFLSFKPNSLCFVLSLFLSLLHFPLSFCLCFFPYLYLSVVLCLFLSFVREAKNQEPLKARTCRKFSRGEPNQGRAKPLKKKPYGPTLNPKP